MKKFLVAIVFLPSLCSAVDFDQDGGGGLIAGTAVTGGTASRLLSTDSSANIQTHVNTQFTGTLTTLKTDISFTSMSVVDAYSDSFGAVTAGSTSTVTWTETLDRLGEFVTSSFTATLAGDYEFVAHSSVSQTAGSACLIIKKNGSSPAGGTVCNQGVTALASILDVSMTRILTLAANDIIRIDASATTSNATFQKMAFTVKRLP